MSEKDYKGNVTAQAWDETRQAADPPFDLIPELGFKENLEFRAAKVKETGIATTNFEKKVAQLLTSDEYKDSGALAVVDSTVNLEAAADGLIERTKEEQAAVDKVDKERADAESAALENAADAVKEKAKDEKNEKPAKQKDESGHVPAGSEVKAAAKAAKTAPLK